MRLACLIAASVALPSLSFAQSCPEPYTIDALLGDLVTVEGALRAGDNATADGGAKKLEKGLACLNELLPTMMVGKTLRAVGAGLYVGGDTVAAGKWLATAAEVDGTFTYGTQDLPEGHPLNQVWDEARGTITEPAALSGKALADGIHYLDGRKIETPAARPDRIHLYQVDAGTVASYLIVGNAFPEERLKGAAVATDKVKKDKPKKGGVTEGSVEAALAGEASVYKRQRPPEKTPLLIAGGALIGGAAALYGLSFGSANQFQNAETVKDIDRLQGATNRLVLLSGAVLAVGIGVETWGIMVSGQGAPMPAVNFRF